MERLTILMYLALSQWASAQEASCVTRSQFLKGAFTAGSVPCDPQIAGPLKYCNARVIEGSELQDVSEAKLDFFDYYFRGLSALRFWKRRCSDHDCSGG